MLDKVVLTRVSSAELASLRERCAGFGVSVSSYVRHALAAYTVAVDDNGGSEVPYVGVDPNVYAGFAYELNRIGNNLNQSAHALNTAALILRGSDLGLAPRDRDAALSGIEAAGAELPAIREDVATLKAELLSVRERAVVGIPRMGRPRPAGPGRAPGRVAAAPASRQSAAGTEGGGRCRS